MSNEISSPASDLSTGNVDKTEKKEKFNPKTGEIIPIPPRYVAPKLNKAGMECPSPITLVAVPALRDFDLGVRIRRFQRAPESLQVRYDDDAYDPDDLDFDDHVDTDGVNPMTPHELRFGEVRNSFKDKEKARQKKIEDARAEKLKADKLAFKELYKSLREEGAIPPADSSANGA